jgi:hypothetical protein
MLARLASRLALVALFTVGVSADIYMHNPRGSNNRLNEKSANRQNADRLFDSQVSKETAEQRRASCGIARQSLHRI